MAAEADTHPNVLTAGQQFLEDEADVQLMIGAGGEAVHTCTTTLISTHERERCGAMWPSKLRAPQDKRECAPSKMNSID